jgi:MFS family permease
VSTPPSSAQLPIDPDVTPSGGTSRETTGGTFEALHTPEFRVLWIGTWLSFVAFFMSTVVNSVVAFELTGLNTAVGWVVFAQGIAMLFLSPIGGALADRLPKRRVVAIGQVTTSLAFASLAYLYATDRIAVFFLSGAALVMGISFSFIGPARQALVVDVVPATMRGNAIALTQVANTGSRVFGPSAAGLFLAWEMGGGATGAYTVMALLYGASASLLWLLPKSRVPENAGDRGLFDDVWIGLRYVARTPRLKVLLTFYTLIIMAGFPHVTLLPGFVENQLGHEASAVSLLFTSSAFGAVAAALGLARFADSPRALAYFTVTGLLFGLSLVGLGLAPNFELAMLAMFGIGAGSGGFQALGASVAAHESDPIYMGRVLSLTMLAFAGFGLLGLPLGWVADQVGEPATIGGMGTVVIILVAVLGVAVSRSQAYEAA